VQRTVAFALCITVDLRTSGGKIAYLTQNRGVVQCVRQ